MRKTSQKVVVRSHHQGERKRSAQIGVSVSVPERSALFRLLDSQFEAIAAHRPSRSRWDPVLRWIAHCGVTDVLGAPVTAGLLAMTWRKVSRERDARGLGRRVVFDPDGSSPPEPQSLPDGHEGWGGAREGGPDRDRLQDRDEEGGSDVSDIKTSAPGRFAFSGAFAESLEEADRHSPLYLFLRENYDAIRKHRPRHGGWHKFLAVVNETGILDGQGNPVTQRVLKRTWHKVNKIVLAERNRPAARMTPPLRHSEPETATSPARPVQPPPPSGGNLVRTGQSGADGTSAPSVWETARPSAPRDGGKDPRPPVPLTLEQAWQIQNQRNDFRMSSGYPLSTELDDDLVMSVKQGLLEACIVPA